MHAELHLRLSTLYGFLTVLARVSGVIALAPIPGFRAGPEASRIVLAIALCLILTPAWPGQVSEGLSISSMLGTVVSELAVGLLIGATLSILLEGVQLSAQIMGLPAGFSYASTIDPSTQADSSVLQIFAGLLGGFLFLAAGFDRQVIRILLDSFQTLPVSPAAFRLPAAERLIHLASNIFVTGLRLALPVLALMLLLDISVAVLGRVQSQLQLLPLAFSLKMLAALAMLASAVIFYPRIIESTSTSILAALSGTLQQQP